MMKIQLSMIPIVFVGVGLIISYSTVPIFVVDHSAETSRSISSSPPSNRIIPLVDGFQQSHLCLYHHHHHYQRKSNKRHVSHLQQYQKRRQCNHNTESTCWHSSLASSYNCEDDGVEEREEESPTSTTTTTDIRQSRMKKSRITPNSSTVRHLMDIILRRYDENGESDGHEQWTSSSPASLPHEWRKTRNYLYKTDLQTLSEQQVLDVMMFLDTELSLSTEVCCHIIQEAPRLLRRPVDSMLRPTAHFLKSLWGDDSLEEALKKNPNLLLTSGLGYIPHNEQQKNKRRRRRRNKTKNKIDGNDTHYDGDDDDNGTTVNATCTTTREDSSDSHSKSTISSSSSSATAAANAANASASIKATTESEHSTDESQATTNEATTIEDILLSRCGFTHQQVANLKKSKPFVFALEISKAMAFIDFLEEVLKPLYYDDDDDASDAPAGEVTSTSMMATIRKIIQTHPTMLGLTVDRALRPKLTFLSEKLGGGGSSNTTTMTDVDIAKIVTRSSGNVLELSIEKNLGPTIDYLLDSVFVPAYLVSNKIFRMDRKQISYDADDDRPLFVVQENDDNRSRPIDQPDRRKKEALVQLKKCLLTHPQILCLNLSNLQKKVDYFHSIGGNHEEEGMLLASRIASRCPQVYSLKLERIQQSVDFLSRVWGCHTVDKFVDGSDAGDGDEHESTGSSSESNKKILARMISEYPNVLTLSIEGNLQPTCNFYNQTGYTSLNENWELVVDDVVKASEYGEDDADKSRSLVPRKVSIVKQNNKNQVRTARIRGRHIAASLYQRLLPRWRFCSIMNLEIVEGERLRQQQQQIKGSKVTDDDRLIAGPRFPSMDLLVMADDAQFCKSLGFDYDRYVQFKREEGPRLRFSSQFDVWLKTGRPIDLQ